MKPIEPTTATSIVICDDDLKIRLLLEEHLEKHHYSVDHVGNGKELLALLAEKDFDIILLDLMLPGEDGLSLCRKIREKSATPIIMITAVDNDIDRVAALEIGADYYMTKPINVRVLIAYIRTILRRHSGGTDEPAEIVKERGNVNIYIFEGWRLNINERNLTSPDGTRITLSYGEFQILTALSKSPRCVLSRDTLLDASLTNERESFDRSVDVLVSRLRKKLKTHVPSFDSIKTIRNVGYVLDCDVKISHA